MGPKCGVEIGGVSLASCGEEDAQASRPIRKRWSAAVDGLWPPWPWRALPSWCPSRRRRHT